MTLFTGDQLARSDEGGRRLESDHQLFTVGTVAVDEAGSLAVVSPQGLATGDFVLKVDAQGALVTDQPEHFYAVVDVADLTVRLRAATAVYTAEDEPPAAGGEASEETAPPGDLS